MIENDKTVSIIDSQGFRFTVYLYNGQDKPTPINKAVIKALVIEETTKDWFIRGFILIEDKYNILQRPWTSEKTPPEGMHYKFRGDGNDTLLISVEPVLEGQPPDALKPEIWNLNLTMSVYDVQDFSFGDETALKYKKLFFWERDYQTMVASKIPFSTASLVENAANLTDAARRVPTGEAMKALITAALGPNETFNDEWDTGNSKILYTSPATETAYQSLRFHHKNHVSSFKGGTTGDFSILSRNRYTRQWSLEPLNSIFGKAVVNNKPGPYQVEHFFIGGNSQEIQGQTPAIAPYKSPINKDAISLETNVHLGQYSTIYSYQFVDMAAIDSINTLVSTPVYSIDRKASQFCMDFENHDIEAVKNYIRTNYVNKLKHTIKPDVLLTLNKDKIEAHTVEPVYSLGATPTDRLASGQNTVLMSSLFLNQCIVFKVQGMTHRTSNKFIGIDRIFGETENDFDNRLLGQWYVIGCKHMFIEDNYINELTCVKLHSCDTRTVQDDL